MPVSVFTITLYNTYSKRLSKLIEILFVFLQLQQAFQEKEDENVRLKHYIDTILLNIVENYPQLLEVKPMERK